MSYEKTNDIEDGKEVWLRHVKKITGLYDVAIVTHPAYEQTNVGLREASEAIDKAIEEQLKRECGDDDDKHDDDKHEETDEEREAREKAEREQREKEEREARELEEQEQRFREQQAMRLRAQHRRREIDIESLNY